MHAAWEAKFEAPTVPKELRTEADRAARARLQRRPSWAAKFEQPHDASLDKAFAAAPMPFDPQNMHMHTDTDMSTLEPGTPPSPFYTP